MSITVMNYHDQTLVDNVTADAARRAAEEEAARARKAAEEAARTAGADFASTLQDASAAYMNQNTSAGNSCPEYLDAIFKEAAQTYDVPVTLLKSIAQAESGFNPNATSHAGAVGIMQLMPQTAVSLGVSDSYNPRENIMGGARLISQLLSKYNGNTALALAAYNAGSGNVEKYGGIPPFTETQNYVRKVISYMNGNSTVSADTAAANAREEINDALHTFFSSQGISKGTLDLLAALLAQTANSDTNI